MAIGRLLLLGVVRGARALLTLPARAIAEADGWLVSRAVGAVVGLYWFAAGVLGECVERRAGAVAALGILLAVLLLLLFPR